MKNQWYELCETEHTPNINSGTQLNLIYGNNKGICDEGGEISRAKATIIAVSEYITASPAVSGVKTFNQIQNTLQ